MFDAGENSKNSELTEEIEFSLLLQAIYQRYGYDFRNYAYASLRRRLHSFIFKNGLSSLSALQDYVLRDSANMARLLGTISVNVSAMFRDPDFYLALRENILPDMRDLPLIRVWHAGCSGGEEVYSMAILMHELGLLNKTRFYATDLSTQIISKAKQAIFDIKDMRDYTINYQKSGGEADFSDYYSANHGSVIISDFLRKNIVWAEHNLVSDASFNEFHIILCRNVMIYFNEKLQRKVHALIHDSLAEGGILGLGHVESLRFSPYESSFKVLSKQEKLYKKIK